MSLRRKTSWSVCVGLLALAILAYFYGPAIGLYYATKRAVKDDASLVRVPAPVSTNNLAQAAGKELEFFGVEFRVPWSGEPQLKNSNVSARVQFPDGQFVMLFDPSTRVDRIKVLTERTQFHDAERVFGIEAMRSNYAMADTILKVTPRDVTLWRPRDQLVRNCVFLMLKKMELTNTETGLFQFQYQDVKGFQKGDPSRSDVVVLDVFGESNREYEMLVGRTKGTTGRVNQGDINLILSTLKPLPTTPQTDKKSEASSGMN